MTLLKMNDTGHRRRATDWVSTDKALELVCSLAMENALRMGNDSVIDSVADAVLKLRELKIQATGTYPILDPELYEDNE